MYKKGFTLIELMVSVTIFIVVMVIALGSLLSISAAERKAEGLKSVMNNLNFSLESMARSIRTGVTYHCGSGGVLDTPLDCPSGDNYLAFIPVCIAGQPCPPPPTIYRYEPLPGPCRSTVNSGCIMRSVNGKAELPITAPEVAITNLTFYVKGAVPEFQNDLYSSQPKVTITLSGAGGSVSSASAATTFSLQTSVTQRLYDQ